MAAVVPPELEALARRLSARRQAGLPRTAAALPRAARRRPLARDWSLSSVRTTSEPTEEGDEPAPGNDIMSLLRKAPEAPSGPDLIFAPRRRFPPPPPPAQVEPAQSLPSALAAKLQPDLGESLDDLRLHTGSAAQAMASRFGAAAFTHGRDVFFAAGRFRPEEPEGRALLAHEAVHARQAQRGQAPETPQAEAEAEAVQRRVLAREKPARGAVLSVSKLVRNYTAEGGALRDHDVVRLDAASAKALAVCERLLANSPLAAARVDLGTLRVPVTLDLEGGGDDQLAETWGRAIAAEIQRRFQAQARGRE